MWSYISTVLPTCMHAKYNHFIISVQHPELGLKLTPDILKTFCTWNGYKYTHTLQQRTPKIVWSHTIIPSSGQKLAV